MIRVTYVLIITTLSFITHHINRCYCWNSSLFQVQLVSLCISECTALPPVWISSGEIWSLPGNLYVFDFSVAVSTSKASGLVSSGSAIYISFCLMSLTPCNSITDSYSSTSSKYCWKILTYHHLSSFTKLVLGWHPFHICHYAGM